MKKRSRIRQAVTVTALVALTAAGVLAIQASASADQPEVVVTSSASTVTPGDTVTVTETVTNINGFTILGESARLFSSADPITSYTSLVSCDPGPGGSCDTVLDGDGNPIGYEAALGTALGGGQSATVTFTLTVDPAASSATETLQGQLFGVNYATGRVDGDTLTVNARADLGVTLTGAPHMALLASNLVFTVKVANTGPGSLTTGKVTATVPTGLRITSTGCAVSGSTAVCSFGPLASGHSATATFSVPVGLLDIGIPFQFSAHRTSSSPTDPNADNDASSTTCTVVSVLLASCG
jgi:uncharacterized repeat protein (TIGR01451 family)